MFGSRADLARITAALDADPFAAFVFAGNEPVCRADARRIERELIAKFSPAPRGSQAGSAQPRAGHSSDASALLASLPGSSAAHTPCHAVGSGLLFNRAHDESTSSQVQQNHG